MDGDKSSSRNSDVKPRKSADGDAGKSGTLPREPSKEQRGSRHRDRRDRDVDRYRDSNGYREKERIRGRDDRDRGAERDWERHREHERHYDGRGRGHGTEGSSRGRDQGRDRERDSHYRKRSRSRSRTRKSESSDLTEKNSCGENGRPSNSKSESAAEPADARCKSTTKWSAPPVIANTPATQTVHKPPPAAIAVECMPSNQTPAPQLAALLAVRKAAELVNANMGVSGSMTAEEKKKLLWGKKKAPAAVQTVAADSTAASSGTQIWNSVHFEDREREEKFQKLMGVKPSSTASTSSPGKLPAGSPSNIEQKHKVLQEELERQYEAGLRRRDGRTVGLGL